MGAGRQPLSPALAPARAAALAAVEQSCARVPRPAALSNRDPVTAAADARILSLPLSELTEGDLWTYASEGGNWLNPAEVAYVLPRLCALIAEGRCPSPIGWGSAFFALKLSGFPQDWPPDRAAAVEGFAAAFALAWLEDPELGALTGCWPERIESLGDLLAMAQGGQIPLPPLLMRLAGAPAQPLARVLAVWSVEQAAWLDPEIPAQDAAETVAFHLANSAFSGPSENDARDTLTAWLLGLDLPSRLAVAMRAEEHPHRRDVLEQAAVLWPLP
ncbi:MAG: hypothetical protein AAGC57_21330 [Pseudomonadota bacterium]